jgi:hypothetical protein
MNSKILLGGIKGNVGNEITKLIWMAGKENVSVAEECGVDDCDGQ